MGFFERHDGPAPGNWLVHDQHGGLSLGSWFDIRGQVVCRVEGSEVAYALAAGDITSMHMVSSTAFLICCIVLAVSVIVLVCIVMKRCTKSKSKISTEANCITCVTCGCVPVAVVVVEAGKKDTADPAEVSALQQC